MWCDVTWCKVWAAVITNCRQVSGMCWCTSIRRDQQAGSMHQYDIPHNTTLHEQINPIARIKMFPQLKYVSVSSPFSSRCRQGGPHLHTVLALFHPPNPSLPPSPSPFYLPVRHQHPVTMNVGFCWFESMRPSLPAPLSPLKSFVVEFGWQASREIGKGRTGGEQKRKRERER